MHKVLLTLLLIASSGAAIAADTTTPPEVPYPAGYRGWHHVKSMVINAGHALFDTFGGIHHLYANDAALKGYRSGTFPDGSVLIFDLLEAKAADSTVQEGARKVVGVMRKDAKAYASTGGWGFEGFKGDSTTDRAVTQQNAATACYACHAQLTDQKDIVFSKLRE